jgi:hypothetical protein
MSDVEGPESLIRRPHEVRHSAGPLLGSVVALALVALAVSVGVAIHELQYASHHPYAYGPAKVIALAAGAGATLAAAVMLLAVVLLRHAR